MDFARKPIGGTQREAAGSPPPRNKFPDMIV
jgi:hypothetical protein